MSNKLDTHLTTLSASKAADDIGILIENHRTQFPGGAMSPNDPPPVRNHKVLGHTFSGKYLMSCDVSVGEVTVRGIFVEGNPELCSIHVEAQLIRKRVTYSMTN
jgi:hypothetical protein